MTVTKNINEASLTAAVDGRIDTTTAPQLERELVPALDSITDLTLDFGAVSYISSAGLRVLLMLQKQMNKKGSMKIVKVNDVIYEIFEVTGFSDILDIERS